MIFNDSFADGEAQSRAVQFAVRDEWFEQLAGNLRRNPRPGILDVRDHFVGTRFEAQVDCAAVLHGIGRVVNEILKHAMQTTGIHRTPTSGGG